MRYRPGIAPYSVDYEDTYCKRAAVCEVCGRDSGLKLDGDRIVCDGPHKADRLTGEEIRDLLARTV